MTMMRLLFVLLMGSALGSAANADSANTADTEYFHQPPASVFELRPHISYQSVTEKPKGGGAETSSRGLHDIGSRFEYGISDLISVFGDSSVSAVETKTGSSSFTPSGLNDVQLGARANSFIEGMMLRYGISAIIGVEKAKFDSKLNKTNNSTGGAVLAPYIGANFNLGTGFIGGELTYAHVFDHRGEISVGSNTVDVKLKNGHIFPCLLIMSIF